VTKGIGSEINEPTNLTVNTDGKTVTITYFFDNIEDRLEVTDADGTTVDDTGSTSGGGTLTYSDVGQINIAIYPNTNPENSSKDTYYEYEITSIENTGTRTTTYHFLGIIPLRRRTKTIRSSSGPQKPKRRMIK
jgi:hypothetical protein